MCAITGFWEYHLDKALYASPPVANHSGAAVRPSGRAGGRWQPVHAGRSAQTDPRALPGNLYVPSELLTSVLPEMLATGSTAGSHAPGSA
jgi:hypothetical protein